MSSHRMRGRTAVRAAAGGRVPMAPGKPLTCKPLTWTAMYRCWVGGRYVKSRSDMQLINKGDTGTNLCQPEEMYNSTNNLITP